MSTISINYLVDFHILQRVSNHQPVKQLENHHVQPEMGCFIATQQIFIRTSVEKLENQELSLSSIHISKLILNIMNDGSPNRPDEVLMAIDFDHGSSWSSQQITMVIPSGKLTFCYGKSPFSMGNSTIYGHFQYLC